MQRRGRNKRIIRKYVIAVLLFILAITITAAIIIRVARPRSDEKPSQPPIKVEKMTKKPPAPEKTTQVTQTDQYIQGIQERHMTTQGTQTEGTQTDQATQSTEVITHSTEVITEEVHITRSIGTQNISEEPEDKASTYTCPITAPIHLPPIQAMATQATEAITPEEQKECSVSTCSTEPDMLHDCIDSIEEDIQCRPITPPAVLIPHTSLLGGEPICTEPPAVLIPHTSLLDCEGPERVDTPVSEPHTERADAPVSKPRKSTLERAKSTCTNNPKKTPHLERVRAQSICTDTPAPRARIRVPDSPNSACTPPESPNQMPSYANDTFSSLQKKQTIRRGKRGDQIINEFLKYRDIDIRLDKEQKNKVNNFIKQQSSHASHFPSKPEITRNAQEMPETTVPEEAHTTEVPEAAVQVDEASEVSQASVVSEEANQPISSSSSSIDTISADSLEE
ncbi:hypothetical protein PAPHI01_2756, partial [Pancytospora philotis]